MPPDNPYPISQKNNTYCEQCLLGTTLLYFYIHVPSNLELNQRRHRRYPLWPGMTWNGMLKYVHCSKYSPSVSRLQLFLISVLLCLVVSFGICSHFQSKKKKKGNRARWGLVCSVSHKCYSSFSCNLWSRAVLSMLNRIVGQKRAVKVSRTRSLIRSLGSFPCKHLREHELSMCRCMSLKIKDWNTLYLTDNIRAARSQLKSIL